MAAGWGQPALPILERCRNGRDAKFFYFWHCCMEKGNREGNGAEAGGHR